MPAGSSTPIWLLLYLQMLRYVYSGGSVPAPRPEVWTTAQENHLKESKRNGKTYPEIRHSMWVAFGIDRNANVLSKRYQIMLERDAKDNVSYSSARDSDTETLDIKGLGHYEVSQQGIAKPHAMPRG